jgi:CheY-like chemotaxis protein
MLREDGGGMVPVSKVRIVVADDNEDMLGLLKERLEPEFEFIAAVRDGRDLLQAVKNFEPDIVITDISMPEMSGIEATRKIVEETLNHNTDCAYRSEDSR